MSRFDSTLHQLRTLDDLAAEDSPIHRLDPRAKIITTLAFIVTVVSFSKYEIAALIPFLIYPAVLLTMSGTPPGLAGRKILLAAPFAVMLGLFNPILDRTTLVVIGSVSISGGWISFFSLLIRFTLTVGAAVVLISTTGMNSVCSAMRRIGIPQILANQLLFLHRYLFVLVEEAGRMHRSRSLRVEKSRISLSHASVLIGQLLLRTVDRAQRIYIAMRCRGFDGEIRLIRPMSFAPVDYAFLIGWISLFAVLRLFNLPHALGKLLMGMFV